MRKKHEVFLGYDIFKNRNLSGYWAERNDKRSEQVQARTLRELRTLIYGLVAARRKGIIR
jgi:hypothetical protein